MHCTVEFIRAGFYFIQDTWHFYFALYVYHTSTEVYSCYFQVIFLIRYKRTRFKNQIDEVRTIPVSLLVPWVALKCNQVKISVLLEQIPLRLVLLHS